MDHDPLCYMAEGKWDGGCQCDLIAKIRVDQDRRNAAAELTRMAQEDGMIP